MLSFKEYVNEIKSRFSDDFESSIQEVNQKLVFELDGKKIEFKSENEKNPNDPEYNFFTYEEALACQKDGWRLPTAKELCALRDNYPYRFDRENKRGIFNNYLYLPTAGYRDYSGDVECIGISGNYWSSTPRGLDAWHLNVYFRAYMLTCSRCYGHSVRLVREIQ